MKPVRRSDERDVRREERKRRAARRETRNKREEVARKREDRGPEARAGSEKRELRSEGGGHEEEGAEEGWEGV